VSNYILDRKWVFHHITKIVFYYLNSSENDEYYGSFSNINIDYIVQYKACFYIQKEDGYMIYFAWGFILNMIVRSDDLMMKMFYSDLIIKNSELILCRNMHSHENSF